MSSSLAASRALSRHVSPSRRAALRGQLLRLAPGAGRTKILNPAAPPQLPAAARILVIRPDHLGDVLFSGPALALLRFHWPDARLTLLVGPWSREVAERLPAVDEVRTLPFPWFDRQPRRTALEPYGRLLRAAGGLRSTPWDAALILRDDDWWGAWLASLAGARLRLGHDRPGVRPFLSHALPDGAAGEHLVSESLALVQALAGQSRLNPDGRQAAIGNPRLQLRLSAADQAAAARLLAGTDPRPLAVHPGSGAVVKRWRTGAWVEALTVLTAAGETVVLTGGAGENALVQRLAEALPRPTLNLAGTTDLGALAAVFARCRLVMGPDSGPLHLAVAVGTPTVHLFGPASAARFGPWGPPERHRVVQSALPCAPCGRLDWPDPANHPCVRLLPVASVVAAAQSCGTQTPTL